MPICRISWWKAAVGADPDRSLFRIRPYRIPCRAAMQAATVSQRAPAAAIRDTVRLAGGSAVCWGTASSKTVSREVSGAAGDTEGAVSAGEGAACGAACPTAGDPCAGSVTV